MRGPWDTRPLFTITRQRGEEARRRESQFRVILAMLEKKMETTIVYWGYIGIMENKIEAAIEGLGFRVRY